MRETTAHFRVSQALPQSRSSGDKVILIADNDLEVRRARESFLGHSENSEPQSLAVSEISTARC